MLASDRCGESSWTTVQEVYARHRLATQPLTEAQRTLGGARPDR